MGDHTEALVTIVVPTYKRPNLLHECLTSIQAQTFPNFKVLVCDNSPSREGQVVVQGLSDPRFEYNPRPTDLGIFGNAVVGFQSVTTPLLMEVDDDDLLYPEALECLTGPLLHNPNVVLAFADIDVLSHDGSVITGAPRGDFVPSRKGLRPGMQQPFTQLAAQGLIYMVAAVVRTDAVDWAAIPSVVATSYDRHIALAASRGARPAWYVDRRVAGYRVHSSADGMRHSWIQLAGAMAALRLELDHAGNPDDRRMLALELLRTRFMLGRALSTEHRWRSILGGFMGSFGTRRGTALLLRAAIRHLAVTPGNRRPTAIGLQARRRKTMGEAIAPQEPAVPVSGRLFRADITEH